MRTDKKLKTITNPWLNFSYVSKFRDDVTSVFRQQHQRRLDHAQSKSKQAVRQRSQMLVGAQIHFQQLNVTNVNFPTEMKLGKSDREDISPTRLRFSEFFISSPYKNAGNSDLKSFYVTF